MNSTLQTGLLVLETLRTGTGPLGVSELARRLGKEKSNVHRVLATLSAHGWVNQDCGTRKYGLGSAWLCYLGGRQIGAGHRNVGARSDPAAWWAKGS